VPRLLYVMLVVAGLLGAATAAQAEDLACLSTTFRFLGPNDKVCISAFDDPKVPGVACHVSQARTGGIKGGLGPAEDPSRFSIACRQIGPITTDISKLPDEESVYSERTSIFFKHTDLSRSSTPTCFGSSTRSATRSSTWRSVTRSSKAPHRIRCRRYRSCRGASDMLCT
jgi:CreA protein